jgi:poly-beta-hydroxyalkanoate depolymerase
LAGAAFAPFDAGVCACAMTCARADHHATLIDATVRIRLQDHEVSILYFCDWKMARTMPNPCRHGV